MKQFHELTTKQQVKALKIATEAAKDCIADGFVVGDKPINEESITDYAMAMAEGAWYEERFDIVIRGIV